MIVFTYANEIVTYEEFCLPPVFGIIQEINICLQDFNQMYAAKHDLCKPGESLGHRDCGMCQLKISNQGTESYMEVTIAPMNPAPRLLFKLIWESIRWMSSQTRQY
jgi:hypothetical protein